jgi:hypothetical protein
MIQQKTRGWLPAPFHCASTLLGPEAGAIVGDAVLASFVIALGTENSRATLASFKYNNVFKYVTSSEFASFISDPDDVLASSMADARIMPDNPQHEGAARRTQDGRKAYDGFLVGVP